VTHDLRALFLVGPKTGHSWHPESRAESNAFIDKALETADRVPEHIRFVTYTTRFNRSHWLTVDGLDETYKRAEVDATRDRSGFTVTTKNISRLTLEGSFGEVTIDSQPVAKLFAAASTFEKKDGIWAVAKKSTTGLRKAHGLQGPVDDAFMDAFLCVRPTGTPWNAVAGERPDQALSVFQANFAK